MSEKEVPNVVAGFDREISAMQAIAKPLADLDRSARGRVIRWAADYFGRHADMYPREEQES